MKDTTRLKRHGSSKGEGEVANTLRAGLAGSRVQIPRNQFGLIWSKLNPWVGSSLGSQNHELSLSFKPFLFWSKPIDFTSKMMSRMFSLDLPLFGLGPSSKDEGFNRIALFNWTLDLSSKAAIQKEGHKWTHHWTTRLLLPSRPCLSSQSRRR